VKVAAFGRTQWLRDAILASQRRGHEIVLIGTCPASPEYTIKEADFERLAYAIGCPFFCDTSINRPEYIATAQESGADIAISVNWATLVGREMIEQFRFGVVNAHAGDLPRFRGNAPANWAILLGEKRAVLTLHQMDAELDSGPILLQREFALDDRTYISDVYDFLARSIPEMFAALLDGLAAGTVVPHPQHADPAASLRCLARLPHDGELDWSLPALKLARLVRASAEPFAGAYSFRDTEKVIVWRAHAEEPKHPYVGTPGQVAHVRRDTGEVAVLTKEGFLVLETVETASAGRVPAAEAFKSARIRFGLNVTQEIACLKARIAELERQFPR